nr:hypothetical protein [Tanacetum cinerariifolium]
EFFLDSDEEMPPVVFVDTHPDDEIADPRVKVETVSESTSSPPLTRRKHLGERGEAFLYDRPVEDFFSFDSDSGDDDNRRRKYFTYLKELLPHVYPHDIQALRRKMNMHFRLNPDADNGLDLWRDVNMLCRSLHADDVEEFWRDQDDWIVSS